MACLIPADLAHFNYLLLTLNHYSMKKLNFTEMEALNGGLLPPGPGEAERCRAQAFAAYIQASHGNPLHLNATDFYCAF